MGYGFNSMDDASAYLEHYGVPGMKRGTRRYQNEDGSYTDAGKAHYGIGEGREQASENIQQGKGVHRRGEGLGTGPVGVSTDMKSRSKSIAKHSDTKLSDILHKYSKLNISNFISQFTRVK